ncbi:CoA ester lyase [Tsuneonella sp. YG55]|jgi:citrate lyase subunit beta / citryl-CoA lyase|uniref:CoA ester lyase n=1 Tax=Tsuneonella litorea TaxID=2976475 RepID=A0A9X2W322_9SPHN|nr:CoA ester lyase [Tsuneonella litorea]MCT2559314.1 CoA ester lyase [Tsuneonella litorea]
MRLRSLLFVPADRPERFAKAAASGADAIILDLEDSVTPTNKSKGRECVAEFLKSHVDLPVIVRVNPLDGQETARDLAAVLPHPPAGVMLPKAEGAKSVNRLVELMQGEAIPILPIVTETPIAIFELGTYREVTTPLMGLTWGAEDLPAAIGAASSRNDDGSYTQPYEMARNLTLFGAHAAGVAAIETVYPDIRNVEGLAAYAARGRRDGFTGMMAIHPLQVAVINEAFTPTEVELKRAREIVELFNSNPTRGVAQLNGEMIDLPHLKQARILLSRVPLPISES